MASYPQVPRRLSVVQAPQSRNVATVSSADAAAPHAMLSKTLSDLGTAAEDISVRTATEAAHSAVTRDENGELKVAEMPLLFGKAADAYKKTAQQSYLNQLDGDIRTAAARHMVEFEGRPQEFAEAQRNYVETLAGKQPNPELQNSVAALANRHFGDTYNGILVRKGRRDTEVAKEGFAAQQSTIENELVALVRGGADTTSPDFLGRQEDWLRIQRDRVANPVFGYGQVQADYDKNQFLSRVSANGHLHTIEKVYRDPSADEAGAARGGAAAAMKAADRFLTDPALNLTEQQRQAYHSRAKGEVRALEAERLRDVTEARAAFRELETSSALGLRVEPHDVERIASAFRAAGAPGEVARVYASFARKPLNDDFGRQPLVEQTIQLNAAKGVASASSPQARQAFGFFLQRGHTPAQAAGIVGNLLHESGLDPTRSHDDGTGIGIAGWRLERRKALRKFAAGRGKTETDFETQLEFVDLELKTSETTAAKALSAAKTPQEAAAAFIHFERPLGYRPDNPAAAHGYANRVGMARASSIANDATGAANPDIAATPAGALWLQTNRARGLNKQASDYWTFAMQEYDQRGVRPADTTITQIVDAARASGNTDLLERIGHDMERVEIARTQAQQPLPSQAAAISELNRGGNAGVMAPGQAATLRDLQRRYDGIRTGLENNPIATAAANFPDRIVTPAPLDPLNSDAFRLGLMQRAKIASFASQNWQVPTVSAIDEADMARLQATLDTANAADKVRIFSDMTQALPEGIRNATLAKLGEKQPAAMVDAFAGGLFRAAPDVATGIIVGQRAITADKRMDPTQAGNGAAFNEQFDKALPASTFGLGARTSESGALATMKSAVRAYYAYRSAQAGDTSGDINEARLQGAVDAVTGGVLKHNGGSLIAPFRGMSQRQFDGVLASFTDSDLADVTTLSGKPVTAAYLRGTAKLESIGDGRYLVLLGSDSARPIYAFRYANTESPQPFELSLRGRANAP